MGWRVSDYQKAAVAAAACKADAPPVREPGPVRFSRAVSPAGPISVDRPDENPYPRMSFSSLEPGTIIVSERSGPVETAPTSTPVRSLRNAT